ncbi:outer membrane beta-barrel protein [Mucilaginibacter xinganensis]|uniref:Outer membrane protein beta-barrel domain-containing protein n=1 Tax=Mucilaginibacter xinganensis TaxID=1234841 RepID=A0A223NTK7_9SPHI|nr:outer membrane beta-barrel protein [Mucilaginibacter xinganensis]ASU33004.1 hypothetical protein MuYL_1104 [Mucilaginibacter xinganensis]
MKLRYFFIAALLLTSITGFAQTGRDVRGTIIDSTKATLPGSSIKLITDKDSMTTITDSKGAFIFNGIKATQFSLVVQSIGYDPIRRRITLDNTNNTVFLKPIILKPSTTMLTGVTITDVVPVKIKEDTVEFNAAAYKVRDGAPVEDLIKKIPGADVDKDGNMTFRGKSVTKVRVNGKDFFGGDLKTATQNLPADAVQNVQMVNDYGDQANLTGIKTGDPETVLNINIKPSRNHGYFGQASAGAGRDAIPEKGSITNGTRYIAQANLFNFSDGQQIAILGNLNNTNTSLFNFGGPGGRQGGGGGPPGSNNNAAGITTARSLGFNYRDSWGKKITVYGSYSFSDNSVNTISSTIQNNISLINPSTNSQSSTQQDEKKNHRLNFNMEYKPDTVNYLKVSPSYSYSGVNTTQNGSNLLENQTATVSNYNFKSLSNSSAPNYGVNALYNHRFNSHGRNFSLNVGVGRSSSNQYQNPVYTYIEGAANAPLDQFINTASHTDTIGTWLSYIEPLSRKSYFEVNYNYRRSYTAADKQTDTLANDGTTINNYPLLSNTYNFTFITNRFGLNYRFVEKKYNYVLGVTAQPSVLKGYSQTTGLPTNSTAFNVSPNAHFIYNFSRSQSFSANYTGYSSQPTYSELQPVTDFSNASYPITGNPELKPEYNNKIDFRYNNFNFESGNVFFSNFSFTKTSDKIVSNTITYPTNYTTNPKLAGTIETQYKNADGYSQAQGFFVFNKPWEKRKYNLFLIGNVTYSNNISYITNVDPNTFEFATEKNVAKTLALSPSIRFRVDIADVIDAQVSTQYTINSSKNSITQTDINNNFRAWVLGVTGKNYVWKDWTYSYDYQKTFYYGYKGATNPNIFNTYIERRFLKGNMATVRAGVYDVFNENTGYTSTQNGNFVTQTNSNKLGRYYLLTFTYRFTKMSGKAPNMGPGGPGRGGFGGPPPGGGGPGGPGGPSAD